MQQSFDLYFVSSNKNKYKEAKQILKSFGVNIRFRKLELEEIQSDSLKLIASKKSSKAFAKLKKPIIIEDDGLFIESLGGFPGPYSSFAFKTIGNKGILNLVNKNRKAKFVSIISYQDKNHSKSFVAKVGGSISKTQQGMGWGYDPIFIPSNSKQTFAKMIDKNKISHRYMALKKFANWYLRMKK